MDQSTNAADVEVRKTDLKVPEEVASCKALDHTACGCVAPESALPIHLLSLWVAEDDI
jgi:hypothetical protein